MSPTAPVPATPLTLNPPSPSARCRKDAAASSPQALWTVLEVWPWPTAAEACAPAAPAAAPSPAWPRARRWPDVDDLGPVEWLPISAHSQRASQLSPSSPRESR